MTSDAGPSLASSSSEPMPAWGATRVGVRARAGHAWRGRADSHLPRRLSTTLEELAMAETPLRRNRRERLSESAELLARQLLMHAELLMDLVEATVEVEVGVGVGVVVGLA